MARTTQNSITLKWVIPWDDTENYTTNEDKLHMIHRLPDGTVDISEATEILFTVVDQVPATKSDGLVSVSGNTTDVGIHKFELLYGVLDAAYTSLGKCSVRRDSDDTEAFFK